MLKEKNYTCNTENEGDTCLCPLEGIIDTLSKKWTLQIVAVIGNHKRLRYNEILAKLVGISTKSLADRLKEMKIEGLIKRKAFAEIPPRVEYTLTKEGEELRRAIMPLMSWASKRKQSFN
jgi:DNA-binding HxlR family transcriptional regulator